MSRTRMRQHQDQGGGEDDDVEEGRKRQRHNDARTADDPWRVCLQEWILEPTQNVKHKLCLLEDEDLLELCEYNPKTVIDAFFDHAEAMEGSLKESGKPNNPMTRYFKLLPNELIDKIVVYTNKQLAHDGKIITDAYEVREMICLFWIRSRYIFPTSLLWVADLPSMASRRNIRLPTHDRFIDVMRAIRGFTADDNREGDGVDECILEGCSDLGKSVLTKKNVPLEIEYLFHGFGGPLAYLWRIEQRERLVKPFVLMYRLEHGGQDPSIARIQELLEEMTWDGYVYKFSYECLEVLQQLGRDGVNGSALPEQHD